MCLFIETIRIENGVVHNLGYHNERFNRTRSTFWNDSLPLNLADYIQPPAEEGIIKCRIVYNETIGEITYAPYAMRPVESLRVVVADSLDYTYKRTDREILNQLFSQRGEADDVLIVRNNLFTDTSIANIALYDGANWFTPTAPLLKGIQRAALLDKHKVMERDIPLEQLFVYSHLTLFNAMIDFGRVILPIHRVFIAI